jgi:Uma2 family endonuclease
MAATAIQIAPIIEVQPPVIEKVTKKKRVKQLDTRRRMSLDRFRDWKPRDGYKYDWNNGEITIYKKMVTEKQRYIVQNLLDFFYEKGLNKIGGLIPEGEMAYSDDKYRIPDMAFYTKAQTRAAAEGQHSVSEFIIEILSDTDLQKNIENKLWEYFEQGVKVVWHILPYRQIVKVYTSPKEVKILLEDDICSAKPVIEDFELTVNKIFELD